MKKSALFFLLITTLFAKDFDYKEALKKNLLFFEAQRSGKREPDKYIYKLSWIKSSATKDGADHHIDLTGGWYDAGDYVKFSLPMSYSASMLGWEILLSPKTLKEIKAYDYALSNLKYALDYLYKTYIPKKNLKNDIFFYQVGDPNIDHNYWMPAEDIDYERKSFFCTSKLPCSEVSAQTAAALAIGYAVFKQKDYKYAKKLLNKAKRLYLFSKTYQGNEGYKMAKGAYDSSGFDDELAFAAIWLYLTTKDEKYLKDAMEFADKLDKNSIYWPLNWGDKDNAVFLLLAIVTDLPMYHNLVQKHLNYWIKEARRTKGGLVFADKWGSLQYAANLAFVALIYANYVPSKELAKEYREFAKNQMDYILGNNPRNFSYLIGYGKNYPKNPHHANAHHSPFYDMDKPENNTYELTGAMVGGPKSLNDLDYEDNRKDYIGNEVSTSYNAPLTGVLIELYQLYQKKDKK